MGSSLSAEPEPVPQMRPAESVKPRQQESMVRISVESIAGMLNVADDRLKKLERAMTKQADSSEIVAASLSKITLLQDTLADLAKQIEELETKLDAVCEAAVELKSLEALDAQHVSTGILNELTKRLHVGGDPVARGLVVEPVKEGQVDKIRRKRDL